MLYVNRKTETLRVLAVTLNIIKNMGNSRGDIPLMDRRGS